MPETNNSAAAAKRALASQRLVNAVAQSGYEELPLASHQLIASGEHAGDAERKAKRLPVRPPPTEHLCLLAPTLDHLQHRPSRAGLRLRITCQRGQRQTEDQLVEFVDVYGELIRNIGTCQAIFP